MRNKNLKILIDLLSDAGVLKTIRRTGWILKGVEEVESVADHSWRVAFFSLILAKPGLNKQKLIEMALVHDLGEIGVGDIKWETGGKVLSSPKTKHMDELVAIKKLFGKFKDSKKYVALLKEYNKQSSPEAKFLKQIDKLEMVVQAMEYEQMGYPSYLFNEFWSNTKKYLKGESLEPLFIALQNKRDKNKD